MSEHLDALRNHESGRELRELLAELARHGSRYDRYEFRGEIARGGMGVVHHVFDRDAGRSLALKTLLDPSDAGIGGGTTARGAEEPAQHVAMRSLHRVNDPHRVVRFLDEARLNCQLDHPGIVPVHEIGCDPSGRLYFTMKLVEGETLRTIIDKIHCDVADWTTTRGVAVLARVCEVIAYAHEKGVIHRDLKPSNVMIGHHGEVYVMDWGLARVLPQPGASRIEDSWEATPLGSGGPTHPSDRYGTPAYMAPEQARGDVWALAPAADIYAIGTMLYHLLSGHAPFADSAEPLSPAEILALVRQESPRPIADLAPSAPRELIAICERAMSTDPGDRYPTAAAMAADLRAFLERRVVEACGAGRLARARKWVDRNRALTTCAAACLILFAAVLGFSLEVFGAEAAGGSPRRRESSIAVRTAPVLRSPERPANLVADQGQSPAERAATEILESVASGDPSGGEPATEPNALLGR